MEGKIMKIEVNNITKKYKQMSALDHVSFTLNEPKIYGLLGRNGAGKTTFMEILAGHILSTDGDILIDGEKPFDNQRLTESICLIKEGNNFKKDLKDRKSTRLNSSHVAISYAVFCLKKKTKTASNNSITTQH